MSTPVVRVEDNPDDAVEVAYFMGFADGRAVERGRAKREWVGLTDEEIKSLWEFPPDQSWIESVHAAIRRAEAKLKEKNRD